MGKIDLTVGACIVHQNKILLLFHTKLKKWLFPGGHIEKDETPDEAVKREVKEETGLDFEFENYSTIPQQPEEIQKCAIPFHANLHNVGDHDHYGAYYLGTTTTEKFKKNNESKDMRYFTEQDLIQLENVPENVRHLGILALKIKENQNSISSKTSP